MYWELQVASGVVAGFFLGDEQCGNGTCVVDQLGVVAQRLHQLFDAPPAQPNGSPPAPPIIVYANEALGVCNDLSGWKVNRLDSSRKSLISASILYCLLATFLHRVVCQGPRRD